MITIRDADLDLDAPMIMVGARDFASRVVFKSLMPKDDAKFIEAVSRIVTLDGFETLIAENGNTFVGMIGILYVPYQWNPEITVAEEIFWWTAKDAPYRTGHLLFKEAMRRIDARPAVPVWRSLTTSPDGVERMYKKDGLSEIETVWGRSQQWQH